MTTSQRVIFFMPLQGDGSNWKWKHKKDVPKTVVTTMNFEPAIPVSYASLLKTKCNCFVQPVISAVGVRGGRSRLYFLTKGLLQLISSHHAHYFSAETHVLILHSSFFTKMHWRCIPGWSFHPEFENLRSWNLWLKYVLLSYSPDVFSCWDT